MGENELNISLRISKEFVCLIREMYSLHGINLGEGVAFLSVLSFSYILLQGMFVPAIQGQGTDEQQQKWLPLAYRMQIIGCYAQTELGHGSNVQGLETTATFDPKTDEFVIHSPTLTSSKVSETDDDYVPLLVSYNFNPLRIFVLHLVLNNYIHGKNLDFSYAFTVCTFLKGIWIYIYHASDIDLNSGGLVGWVKYPLMLLFMPV